MLIIHLDGSTTPTGSQVAPNSADLSGMDGMVATIAAESATSVAYNEPLTVTDSGAVNN